MRRPFAIMLLFTAGILPPAAVCAAASDGQKPTAPANTAVAQTIPADAVANADGTWSYTDKKGKHWTYTKTPFGVSRVPAAGETKAVAVPGLPKGAVRNADGTFSWTDHDGKKWTYTNTPFGVARSPALDGSASASPGVPGLKVTDKGATVRFERASPMGPMVWEKKKAELSDEERRAYESQKPE